VTPALSYLDRPDGARIAYHRTPGASPGVVFLGGYRSDMTGIKATSLEAHCREQSRAFVRFDYFGHGQSSGEFLEGTIGRWAADAVAVLDAVTDGPQVLIGSSMGGWLMLLAALARPERVAALVGIAAAPDFTEDLLSGTGPPETLADLERDGVHYDASVYSDEPYPITRRLVEESRAHLLLHGAIPLTCPVRLLHGLADGDVPWQTSLRLANALASDDVTVTLVKDGDHRLSTARDIERLWRVVAEVVGASSITHHSTSSD
jgi:pimeloyl-ACP methyl ester carboxylesterase